MVGGGVFILVDHLSNSVAESSKLKLV
jgi:hypothetical protein